MAEAIQSPQLGTHGRAAGRANGTTTATPSAFNPGSTQEEEKGVLPHWGEFNTPFVGVMQGRPNQEVNMIVTLGQPSPKKQPPP